MVRGAVRMTGRRGGEDGDRHVNQNRAAPLVVRVRACEGSPTFASFFYAHTSFTKLGMNVRLSEVLLPPLGRPSPDLGHIPPSLSPTHHTVACPARGLPDGHAGGGRHRRDALRRPGVLHPVGLFSHTKPCRGDACHSSGPMECPRVREVGRRGEGRVLSKVRAPQESNQ